MAVPPVSSVSSTSSNSHLAEQPLLIQPMGRWQGGKGKYSRHYEVWPADLVEVQEINGWRIRRCDMAHILVLDPLPPQQYLIDAGGNADANAANAASGNDHRQAGFVLPFPPRQYRMVIPLLMRLGEPVPYAALFAEGAYDPERDAALRERVVKPLRKKLATLGLSLLSLIGYGYLVQVEEEAPDGSQVISSPAAAPDDPDASASTKR